MNELAESAAAVLPNLIDRLAKAEDFILEQAPLVLQELLRWHFIKSLISFIFVLIFTAVCIIGGRKLWLVRGLQERIYKQTRDDGYGGPTTCAVLLYLFMAMACSTLIFSTLDWLHIWIAPRVWLIEYAATLVK